MSAPLTRIRLSAAALALAGTMFALYPGLRPWRDEATLQGAQEAMSSPWWVATHLFAMIGFILVPLALFAVRRVVEGTRAEPLALTAAVTAWIGAGLTLPYYGAEDFGLHVLAAESAAGAQLDLLGLAEAIRYQPVAMTTFGVGLVALAVGAVMAAVAIARSGVLPRLSGALFAVGFAAFLPQFFTPAAVRVGHGLLVAAGCLWLATALWRATRPATPVTAAPSATLSTAPAS
ncbi:hypothetical protein Cme02nite_66600 [Catellatospora methionotrophica]|uniref:DUF4386 family protein n=1 Tax=Catellatospora methionotrophica TaxID=121620 RepID=A0A8J3LHB6_9ACTN|nr:hypothetical protein [Catellatospora methionotrophica]GIG18328.1 hypothetical protein Cme02nite_66600 [Catellatospora methionotrophica]